MKHENTGKRRIRIAAAVCAVLIVAGTTAGVIAARAGTKAQAAQNETKVTTVGETASTAKRSGSISAGGTVTSAQNSDSLGMVNTSVRLTVGEILVEAGDSVKTGTALYRITEDSLTKAKKTLQTELKSAESALLQQKIDTQLDKNKAVALYESELALGDTVQDTYETGLSALDSALQEAYDAYAEALDTVNNTPSEISGKQNEIDCLQTEADDLTADMADAQKQADQTKTAYTEAAAAYNTIAEKYNDAAAVVRYLGKALGRDTDIVSAAKKVEEEVQKQETAEPERTVPEDMSGFSGGFSGNGERPARGEGMNEDSRIFFAPNMETVGELRLDPTEKTADSEEAAESDAPDLPDETAEPNALTILYESAYEEYQALAEQLETAESEMQSAEREYKSDAEKLSAMQSEKKEIENQISDLEKEVSSLESALSKAQSNLSKLRSEYNSLKASYATDQLELENTRNTDTAAYENAEYHYEITCSTIEEDLQKAQDKYDTAVENLRIFDEEIKDGSIYSLNAQEGRNLSVSAPLVYYVDESSFAVTVEIDQNNVTQISIGDSALIYSSESGTVTGKVTAISAGTSTSLADVRFNVTVTANAGANLYSGESVNVYFNAGNMKASEFTDFSGKKSSERTGENSGSGRTMPDMSGERPSFGGMPEGFDPSKMGGFGGRKEG